jgi:hypothetical protein
MRRAATRPSSKPPRMGQRRAKGRAKTRGKKTTSVIEITRAPLRPKARVAKTTGPQWHRLHFFLQHQHHSNWCWAALATSVALYFRPASTWTQCAVANGELRRKDCCGKRAGRLCNVYGHLQISLKIVDHLDHRVHGTATFGQVQREVDGGRPLGVRTAWSGGGAHFLAIIGYDVPLQMLCVDDPLFGKSDVDYSTFCADYHDSGTWTDSYYVKL